MAATRGHWGAACSLRVTGHTRDGLCCATSATRPSTEEPAPAGGGARSQLRAVWAYTQATPPSAPSREWGTLRLSPCPAFLCHPGYHTEATSGQSRGREKVASRRRPRAAGSPHAVTCASELWPHGDAGSWQHGPQPEGHPPGGAAAQHGLSHQLQGGRGLHGAQETETRRRADQEQRQEKESEARASCRAGLRGAGHRQPGSASATGHTADGSASVTTSQGKQPQQHQISPRQGTWDTTSRKGEDPAGLTVQRRNPRTETPQHQPLNLCFQNKVIPNITFPTPSPS